jgi:hypothetical protein
MTVGGWAIMLLSLVFVWGLTGWCFYRVLTGAPEGGVSGTPAALGA